MAQFEALGRDAVNAANSLDDGTGDGKLAKAVKATLDWFGDGGANHLLVVRTVKDASGAAVTVEVKERDVYVSPTFEIPEPAQVVAPEAALPSDAPVEEAPAAETASPWDAGSADVAA